jgi:hypothetical protein
MHVSYTLIQTEDLIIKDCLFLVKLFDRYELFVSFYTKVKWERLKIIGWNGNSSRNYESRLF